MGDGVRFLQCDAHGHKPWRGTVLCSRCRKVYQTHDDGADHYATELCACGVRLMPSERDRSEDFSGRAICEDCYHTVIAAGGFAPAHFGSA